MSAGMGTILIAGRPCAHMLYLPFGYIDSMLRWTPGMPAFSYSTSGSVGQPPERRTPSMNASKFLKYSMFFSASMPVCR